MKFPSIHQLLDDTTVCQLTFFASCAVTPLQVIILYTSMYLGDSSQCLASGQLGVYLDIDSWLNPPYTPIP